METPRESAKNWLLQYASELRFPWLFGLTLGIFAVDLVLPDFIPFVDEILLGLLALILAMIKKRRLWPRTPADTVEGNVIGPDEQAPRVP